LIQKVNKSSEINIVWEAAFIYNLILFVLSLHKAKRFKNLTEITRTGQISLWSVLVEDGMIIIILSYGELS